MALSLRGKIPSEMCSLSVVSNVNCNKLSRWICALGTGKVTVTVTGYWLLLLVKLNLLGLVTVHRTS